MYHQGEFFEDEGPEEATQTLKDPDRGLIKFHPYLDAPENWEPSWLIKGLIQKGGLNFIQGEPKAHKSMFRRYLLTCMLTNEPVFGQFPIESQFNRAGLVLTEDDPGAERAIMDKICDNYGLNRQQGRDRIVWAETEFFDLLDGKHRTNLGRAIRRNDIDLIILDPLCNFHNAEENDATQMARVNGALRHLIKEYGVTVVVIHHNNKGAVRFDSRGRRIEQSVVNRGRGSSAIPAGANVIIDLENLNQGFGPWQLHKLQTKCKSARDTDLAILIECLDEGEETWLWRVAEESEINKKRAENTKKLTQEDVEVFIGENPGLSRSEIRTELGFSSQKVSSFIQELIEAKLVHTKKLGRKVGHYSS